MRRFSRVGVVLAVLMAIASPVAVAVPAQAGGSCPWMDTSKTADQRAHLLLAAMTIDQKIAMVHQPQPFQTHYGMAGWIPAQPALCIPDLVLNDAGQGVGDGQVFSTVTAYPAPIAQAASWDVAAQQAMGRMLGNQAWNKGVNVQLAPDINIARVPLNGRNFEAFGEDPYLTGQTGAAVIRGIQQNPVIADVKHYAANNQETNRMTSSSDVDERTLQEIYFPGFEAAIKDGDVGSAMCSYNLINGKYACENAYTQNTVMKGQMGFQGFIVSDWGATHSTVDSANNGLDMEMNIFGPSTPGQPHYFDAPLKQAITVDHTVPMSRLDDMVLRITRAMFKYGIFDHPAAAEPAAYGANVDTAEAQLVAQQTAEKGAVLLKNDAGILPLPGGGQRIALIGSPAGHPGAELVYNGGGSSHVPEAVPPDKNVVSPLEGMTTASALGTHDVITYADGTATADAVAAASAADVAVVFAYDGESEGNDRQTLALTPQRCNLFFCISAGYDQNALIDAVTAANPNTIVVLTTGGPVLMPWLSKVKAVLEAWYPGQQMGTAIANLLYGNVNPSGKLPETFPKSEADLPTRTTAQYPGGSDLQVHYTEGLDVGYRWYDDRSIEPLFPFGHGLSYTTFAYSNLRVTPAATPSGQATVSFAVTNTGRRAGAEVPQVYIGAPTPNPVGEPLRQLRGYEKVELQPGQTRHLSIPINSRAVSYWNTSIHGWAVEPGCHPVQVGSSSRDIRLQGVGLDGALGTCVLGATTAPATPATENLPNTSSVVVSAAAQRLEALLAGLVALIALALAAAGLRRLVAQR